MALAYCHSKGDGVEENQEKAFEYHQLAAEKGVVFSSFLSKRF